VNKQPDEAINEILPGARRVRQALFQKLRINFGECHGDSRFRSTVGLLFLAPSFGSTLPFPTLRAFDESDKPFLWQQFATN
jgi:hypothetical protein